VLTRSSIPPATIPRVVVVGAGFAGHQAARGLLRRLGGRADVVVVLDALLPRQTVQLGLVRGTAVPLDADTDARADPPRTPVRTRP
jgi:NADPH-dependent 2,4-dienoyl-CoA reductase/sulfur reductase-like enzyme